jgi:hypothetical protein
VEAISQLKICGAVIKDYPDALRLLEVPLSQLQDIDTVQQLDILRE